MTLIYSKQYLITPTAELCGPSRGSHKHANPAERISFFKENGPTGFFLCFHVTYCIFFRPLLIIIRPSQLLDILAKFAFGYLKFIFFPWDFYLVIGIHHEKCASITFWLGRAGWSVEQIWHSQSGEAGCQPLLPGKVCLVQSPCLLMEGRIVLTNSSTACPIGSLSPRRVLYMWLSSTAWSAFLKTQESSPHPSKSNLSAEGWIACQGFPSAGFRSSTWTEMNWAKYAKLSAMCS